MTNYVSFFPVCPVGTFGDGCQELCECVGGETCDPATGKCDCGEGRKGFHCEDGKSEDFCHNEVIRLSSYLIFVSMDCLLCLLSSRSYF